MRSVVVVLPASICAMMPILRQRSSGTVRDEAFFLSSLRTSCSPTVLTGVELNSHLIRFGNWGNRAILQFKSPNLNQITQLPNFPNYSTFFTTDNARTPYWLPPCGVHLLSS